MNIRKAEIEDGSIIGDIHVQCRREMPYAPSAHTDGEILFHFAEDVVPRSTTYVAEEDPRVLAYMTLEDGWIKHLYVYPEAQRRGTGNALLALAKETTPEGLQLWTFQANEGARRFYEHHGFRAVEFTDGQGNEEKAPDVRYVWP